MNLGTKIGLAVGALALLGACGSAKFQPPPPRGPRCKDDENPVNPYLPRNCRMFLNLVVNGLAYRMPIPDTPQTPHKPENGSVSLYAERPSQTVVNEDGSVTGSWSLLFGSEPPFYSDTNYQDFCLQQPLSCGLANEYYDPRRLPTSYNSLQHCFLDPLPEGDIFDCPADMFVRAGILARSAAEGMRHLWQARVTARFSENYETADLEIQVGTIGQPTQFEVFRDGAPVAGIPVPWDSDRDGTPDAEKIVPTFPDSRYFFLNGALQCRMPSAPRPLQGKHNEIAPVTCCEGDACGAHEAFQIGSIQMGIEFFCDGEPTEPQEVTNPPDDLPSCQSS